MSYRINGINANYPTGTFLPYGGTTDPPGWVICDGVSRTNTGIYDHLISMNIGFAGTGTWSPFNLKDCTMFGDNASTTLFSKIGSRANTLTVSQMPTHTHSYTISAHNNTHIHVYADPLFNDNNGGERPNGDGGLGESAVTRTTSANVHDHADTTSNANGSGTSINNLNYSYIINWIVKI